MKRAALFALFIALLTGCAATPQKKAQAAAEFHLGYILHYTGSGYKSVDFGALSPLYASAEDSTIVGYYLDHSYTNGAAPSPATLCYARFYFPPDLGAVAYHYCHGINWEPAPVDSTGRAILSGAAQ